MGGIVKLSEPEFTEFAGFSEWIIYAIICSSLLFALPAFAQQTSVAVLPSDGSLSSDELEILTDKMREAALKVLPTNAFTLLKQDVVVKRLGGQESYVKECRESSCIVDLGKKAQVDYVVQASVRKLGALIMLKVELYHVGTEGLVGMLNDEAENVRSLLSVVEKKAPDVFGKIPGASGRKAPAPSPSFAGGVSGVQTTGEDYEFDGGKSYLASITTEPEGAVLSFDGAPDSRCAKTPCTIVLAEGNVRIVASLEQYERGDTTVFVRQNNQSVSIRLKANFGVLEVKPAYLDGVGKSEGWSLSLNGKAVSSWENRLSPGAYKVELNHRCYDAISFEAGINKDKREVFDMANYVKLKKGGLVLDAERNGEPISEPVYVNGKQAGETPFSGSVPICAEIELGNNKEKVDVVLRHNEKVVHTVKSSGGVSGGVLTDSRDSKRYKVVKIGTQTWMAENLNYNANGSKCYSNSNANCDKYGRLYNWSTAKSACPKGWHLPSDGEWTTLAKSAGGTGNYGDGGTAGTKLKAKSGWNNNGNGTDEFGFSALPGGYGNSSGSFYYVGSDGSWWSSTEYSATRAYYRDMSFGNARVGRSGYDKGIFRSVRCVQD
jgi:uncharacterized protein (TIGR02145 family)